MNIKRNEKMPKKQNSKNTSQNTAYYIARIIQRISLLVAAASTFILWATLISISHTISFVGLGDGINNISQDELNNGITREIDKLTMNSVVLSIAAIVITILMLKFLSVRNNEKRLVVDGFVIAGFCLVVSMFAQSIYTYILSRVI